MKYRLPDLINEFLIKYRDEFLSINNLKVGDVVTIPFNNDILRPKYRGGMERFNSTVDREGVLKIDKNGFLYAESIEVLAFFEFKSNGLTGRSRREWYQKTMKKSIYKFGNINIYKKLDIPK